MTRARPQWLQPAGNARTLVKVCCISSIQEASIARAAGADLLGLVSAMPSGPGPIDEALIGQVVEWVARATPTVLLTCRQDAASIGAQLDRMRPDVVQLVDDVAPGELARLRETHPEVALMQVIHVRDQASVDEALRVAPLVDAILLDSGNPSAAVKELGGTGRVHDWRLSRAIRDGAGVPVLLAGGLNAGNVAAAIAEVRPFGVDVCSGVRTAGALDPVKVRDFVQAAKST